MFRSINMGVLHDEKNLLRLRTHMPKKALYKYVGNNINLDHLDMLPTTTNITKGGENLILEPFKPLYAMLDSMEQRGRRS